MELQLALSLANHNHVKCLDLNNKGLEPKERIGLQLWGFPTSDDHVCMNNNIKKRKLEDACGDNIKDAPLTLPLLLWSGQPNEDEDEDGGDQKKKISCMINKDEEEQDDHVVGWPPIKSWRKKLLHGQQHQQGGHVMNNRVAYGSNSMYVKVRMEGVGITRKIDLRLYNSYQELNNSLINMFGQKLESECYTLTYQDRDGDWLLAGDVPWQTFIQTVQRLEVLRNCG